MNFKIFVLFLVQFLVLTNATPRNCITEFGINDATWIEVGKDTANPPEKVLCYLKCEYEVLGAIKEDKTLHSDKMVEKVQEWKTFDEPIRSELKKCIEKDAVPLNKCTDMKPYYMCVREAGIKQDAKAVPK